MSMKPLNEENHANEALEAIVDDLSNQHANDASNWFTDGSNEEYHVNQAVEEIRSNLHANNAANADCWFIDVHNDDGGVPAWVIRIEKALSIRLEIWTTKYFIEATDVF